MMARMMSTQVAAPIFYCFSFSMKEKIKLSLRTGKEISHVLLQLIVGEKLQGQQVDTYRVHKTPHATPRFVHVLE